MCSKNTGCTNLYPKIVVNKLTDKEIKKWTLRSLHKVGNGRRKKSIQDLENDEEEEESKREESHSNIRTRYHRNCEKKTTDKSKTRKREHSPSNLSKKTKSSRLECKVNNKMQTRSSKESSPSQLNDSCSSHSSFNNNIDVINIYSNEEIHIEESSLDDIKNFIPEELDCSQGIVELKQFSDSESSDDVKPIKYENTSPLKEKDSEKELKTQGKEISHSEVEIVEEIENLWFEIDHAEPLVNKKTKTQNLQKEKEKLNKIAELINENKILTIPIPIVTKFSKAWKRDSDDVQIIKEVKKVSDLDLNLRKTLNVDNYNGCQNTTKDDSETSINSLKTDNNNETQSQNNTFFELKFDEICWLYSQYFTPNIKSLIKALVNTLELLFREFHNERKINNLESFDIFSDSFTSSLKKYSSQFVNLFEIIVTSIDKSHRKNMIPIVHLHIMKGMENLCMAPIKPQYIRYTILRIFEVEKFVNNYYIIDKPNISYEESAKLLAMYETWLGNCLETDSNVDNHCSDKIKETGYAFNMEKSKLTTLQAEELPQTDSSSPKIDLNKETSDERETDSYIFEGPRIPLFETQEGCCIKCANESCTRELTVLCYYCKEPVTCNGFCEVEYDQVVLKKEVGENELILFSCKPHTSIIQDSIQLYEEKDEAAVEETMEDSLCWRANCNQRAMLVCVCKTRAYCTSSCQSDDWNDVHYMSCPWTVQPELLLHPPD